MSGVAHPGRRRAGARLVDRFRTFVVARFNPKTYLGLHLTLGLMLGSLGLWAFSALLDAVLDNAVLVRWDYATDAWIHAHVTPGGLRIFDVITRIGSPSTMAGLAVLGVIVLWRQQRWTMLVTWAAAFAGCGLLERVVKALVHRTRPVYGAAYLSGHSYSFPSGHAMGSMLGFGMCVYLLGLYWHPRRALWHHLLRLLAAGLIILVGVSRIYLGVHYPSDVLGGYAAGATWMAVCISGAALALHGREAVSSI